MDLLQQLDPNDDLIQLGAIIRWSDFNTAFSKHYTEKVGAPSKLIRLIVGLLILKQLENLSDEQVVLQWKRNPYYQVICGFREFCQDLPCHNTELVHIREQIGEVHLRNSTYCPKDGGHLSL